MKRALIVDDEEQARLYLAKMIATTNTEMEVQFASSPDEALFVLTKFKPDVLFIDVEMPGMSGLEMLQQLREKHPHLPVVIVSAYSEFKYVQKSIRLNVKDYLIKPVHPDELETVIRKVFENKDISTTIDNKIRLKTIKGILHINPEEILYFESHKRDSHVYFIRNGNNILVRSNLVELEKILPKSIFQRVSRQYIVNTRYIKFVNKNKFIVLESDEKQIKLERIYPNIIEKYTQ